MRAIQILRTDDGSSTELLGALVAQLADRGQVGTVTDQPQGTGSGETAVGLETARSAGATAVYAVGPERWNGTGEGLSIRDALDQLAPVCDYGIVHAHASTRLPTVTVDDRTNEDGQVLSAADSWAEFDVRNLVERIEGVDHYETLESLVSAVKQSADEELAGAIATFTGRVRAKDGPDDESTEYLEFERYDEPAAERMAAIAADLEGRDGVYDVRLFHKTGVVEAGEDIVHVVVLAGHRAEAFTAVQDGINRLKAEVPLFKKEITETEVFWAHERDDR